MGNIWWLISTAWSQMDKRFATPGHFHDLKVAAQVLT